MWNFNQQIHTRKQKLKEMKSIKVTSTWNTQSEPNDYISRAKTTFKESDETQSETNNYSLSAKATFKESDERSEINHNSEDERK